MFLSGPQCNQQYNKLTDALKIEQKITAYTLKGQREYLSFFTLVALSGVSVSHSVEKKNLGVTNREDHGGLYFPEL